MDQDAVVLEQGLRICGGGVETQDLWWRSRDSGFCGGVADTQDAVVLEQGLKMLWFQSRDSGAVVEEQRLRIL
jgi:hypothetical protein